MNHIQRGQELAEKIIDTGDHADRVVFARYSAEDFPNVIAAGLATISFEEYGQRLAGAIAILEQEGTTVLIVSVTAQQLAEAMAIHALPNTPDGRAAAIGYIFLNSQQGTKLC